MEPHFAIILLGLEMYLVPKMVIGGLALLGGTAVAVTETLKDSKDRQICQKCEGRGLVRAFDAAHEDLGEVSCRKCGGVGTVG